MSGVKIKNCQKCGKKSYETYVMLYKNGDRSCVMCPACWKKFKMERAAEKIKNQKSEK